MAKFYGKLHDTAYVRGNPGNIGEEGLVLTKRESWDLRGLSIKENDTLESKALVIPSGSQMLPMRYMYASGSGVKISTRIQMKEIGAGGVIQSDWATISGARSENFGFEISEGLLLNAYKNLYFENSEYDREFRIVFGGDVSYPDSLIFTAGLVLYYVNI